MPADQDIGEGAEVSNLIVGMVAWVAFVVVWVRLSFYLVSRWKVMKSGFHDEVVFILFFFAVLWVSMLNKKETFHVRLMTCFALAIVEDLIHRVS